MADVILCTPFETYEPSQEMPLWAKCSQIALELQPLARLAVGAIRGFGETYDPSTSPFALSADGAYETACGTQMSKTPHPKSIFVGAVSLLLLQGASTIMEQDAFRKAHTVTEEVGRPNWDTITGSLQLTAGQSALTSAYMVDGAKIKTIELIFKEEVAGDHRLKLIAHTDPKSHTYSVALGGGNCGYDEKVSRLCMQTWAEESILSRQLPEQFAAATLTLRP